MPEHLTSMRVDPDTKKDDAISFDENPFGFGLQLNIDDDRMKKLGFDKPLPAGEEVVIVAHAKVESATESSDKDGEKVSMTLQITDMGVEPNRNNLAEKLFGKQRTGEK